MNFFKLSLKPDLVKNLQELGYVEMTPVQEHALPLVLQDGDILVQAKTGSGKTAVFGLGILNSLEIDEFGPAKVQALVICPTRELAEQVARELRRLARLLRNIKVVTLCGGSSEVYQERSLLHGAHIIVGTPGRLLRFINKRSLQFPDVRTLVLDEGDRLLGMGFHDDLMQIISKLPLRRQTWLFSATFPEEIKTLSLNIQKSPHSVYIDLVHDKQSIEESFYKLPSHTDKKKALLEFLGNLKPESFIVFCKTKQITDDLAKYLLRNSLEVASIHGDLLQRDRTLIFSKFMNGSLCGLIATDVASRGLDIQDVSIIFNYDFPSTSEVYIHRVGRTGRAGGKGHAITFFVEREMELIQKLEADTGRVCSCQDFIPSEEALSYDLTAKMATIHINGGKREKLRPGDILGALIAKSQLLPEDVGNISIFSSFSYVAIRRDKIQQAIQGLSGEKIKNKKFRIEIA